MNDIDNRENSTNTSPFGTVEVSASRSENVSVQSKS